MILAPAALRPAAPASQLMWVMAAMFVGASFLTAAVAHFVSISASAGLFAMAAAVLLLVTAWRPALGCAVLALTVPLTAGLGRDTVLPLLRISEAATITVTLGALLHHLPRRGAGRFSGLDLAIGAYGAGAVLIPSLVLFVSQTSVGLDSWRYILQPIQYLVIYWLFSRTNLTGRSLVAIINLAMAASVAVAVLGLAQLADVPGVRGFLAATYPLGGGNESLCPYGICRPMSLLEHPPAFGGYALLNFILALALAARRHLAFPSWWLATTMALNAAAVLATQTQAAVLGLGVATILVGWHARRLPREIMPAVLALAVGVIIFFPQLTARFEQQFSGGTGTPASLATRYQYWGEYFLPDLPDHLLTGTGTVIPTDVPTGLTTFVDNEYLRLTYRAGALGVVLLVVMYPAIAVVGWRQRHSIDPWRSAVGAAAVSYVAVMAIMGTTAEYLTFSGLSQQFWMLVGLLGAVTLANKVRRGPTVELGGSSLVSRPSLAETSIATVAGWSRRVLPERALVQSSAIVFLGNTIARLLGFLFSLAVARLLLPSGYGVFAYALTIATIGSILIFDTPIGLSRTLATLRQHRHEKDAAFSNTLVVAAGVLGVSVVATLPGAWLAGIRGWMLVAVALTLAGNAVYVTYREAMRGEERYVPMVGMFVVANLLELVGVLVAAATGHASPTLFLALYGLSYVGALVILLRLTPLGLDVRRHTITLAQTRSIIGFVSPLFVQTAFLNIWLGADLLIVNRLISSASAGQYAAAKTLANVFYLAPAAIGGPLLPKVARLVRNEVRPYVLRVLGLVTVVTLPLLASLIILRHPVFGLVFGARYLEAAAPFVPVAIAMALYGLYQVFEHTWVGRGRPIIDTFATAAGACASLGLLLVLVPRAGLVGAGLAFLAGAVVQLLVIGGITIVALGRDAAVPAVAPGGLVDGSLR